jgi:predicted secreted protein
VIKHGAIFLAAAVLGAALTWLLATGCCVRHPDCPDWTPEEKQMHDPSWTVVVTEANSGNTVPLRVGDTLLVQLRSQLGTGFSWRLTKEAEQLKLISTTVEGDFDGKPGGAQMQVFKFSVVKTGKGEMALRYQRPNLAQPHDRLYSLLLKVRE